MHVLFVNRHFDKEHVPTGRMLGDVAKLLVSEGCEVTVLTAKISYVKTMEQDSACEHVRVRYLWTCSEAHRALTWLLFWLQACLLTPLMRWDRCVILTDPPFMVFIAFLTNCWRRVKRPVFWWTMDLYPEAILGREIIKHGGLLHRLLQLLNELGVSQLTGVICLGSTQHMRLKAYRTWPERESFCLKTPPWDFRPIRRVEKSNNLFIAQQGYGDRRIALYAGNMGYAHCFEELLAAAAVLGERDRSWLFVFVVRGPQRAALEAMSKELPNVVVLDYQPVELTADLLWAADVHLITTAIGYEGVTVPSKIYGILETDAPTLFIGPADADTSLEIQRYCAGKTLPCGCSGEQVAEALEELATLQWRRPKHPDRQGPQRIAKFVTGELCG